MAFYIKKSGKPAGGEDEYFCKKGTDLPPDLIFFSGTLPEGDMSYVSYSTENDAQVVINNSNMLGVEIVEK
tara:strand:+ start:99 stop:311 length:213 start_codon:yes stop_codon:yes gene_type:complete